VILHERRLHEVNCSISFYSGKKRAEHNGFKIVDVVDKKETLDFMVFVGLQRVIFVVDEAMEFAEVEPQPKKDPFAEFKNEFSGAVREVYEKVFG
jgi:hypothetical protein